MDKIIEARITKMPKTFGDPMPEVWVKTNGHPLEQKLFSFYPDEIMFRAEEFVGLTIEQAHGLKFKKDKQWMQSSSRSPVY